MKKLFQIVLLVLTFHVGLTHIHAHTQAITADDCNFQVGEMVEVYDPIEKNWFSSKILKAESQKWFIHYEGYDSKWDTWATCDRIRRHGESKPTPGTSTSGTQTSQSVAVTQMNGSIPKICPTENITLNIGDPIMIKQEDQDRVVKLNIINLDFSDQMNEFKFYAVESFTSVYFNWNDIELDPNYTYTKLPEAAQPSKNDVYNIGEQIESFWTANDQFGQYEIVQGIIISKDGDNFYIYFEEENSKSSHYEWRYISDIRSPGSSKNILLVTQNGNPKENLSTCKTELNACYAGGFSNKWDFLWYYRHDLKFLKGQLSPDTQAFTNTNLLQDVLKFYECQYQVRKKYPDVGYSGKSITDRYDVQYEFLKDYKNIIKKAFDTRIISVLNNIVTDTQNGFYVYELARTDGKKLLKDEMVKTVKDYDANYKILGSTITYPEAELNAAYDKALVKFMSEGLEVNDGLVNEGHTFAGKDARVEQLCIADLQKLYPGAKVLKSGCYNNEFLVELNSLGVPIYRTKTVLIIFQSSLFRTTVEAKYTLREEYIGNNQYGKPSFPRRGTLTYLK